MVNVIGIPEQVIPARSYSTPTVIVAVTGVKELFVATNDGILPVPLAAIPILGLLFVQIYVIVPPVVGLLKFIALFDEPLHNT